MPATVKGRIGRGPPFKRQLGGNMLDRTTLTTRVINLTAPRKELDRLEKSIRQHIARIDSLTAELRSIVDSLGENVVTVTAPSSAAVMRIIECVAAHTGVSADTIRSERQLGPIARARQICFYLADEMTSFSMTKLGQFFGRDYSTVRHGIHKIRGLLLIDAKLKSDIAAITATIEGRA